MGAACAHANNKFFYFDNYLRVVDHIMLSV